MTLNLESGLLSRAEPLCGAIAPFTEVRFPNILHTAKANICSDILGCSKFPEMMHYCIGISNNTDRIEVERTFSLSKRCYGMSCITTKLEETQLTSIALSVFVTNLFKIQRRILCTLLHLFQLWYGWSRCKSWKLQISA